MTAVLRLLWPRARSLKNQWDRAERGERTTYVFFALLSIAFWGTVFAGMAWLVDAFHSVEVFGPILTRKLMDLLLTSLFGLLAFSNVVTALSTFYLSEDLQLLLSLPIHRAQFHFARLIETIAQSSWMMLVFGVPVFAAYGVTHGAGIEFYVVLAIVVPALVAIPASFGLMVASVLVSVFPARRLRELLAIAGLGALGALFVLIRMLRPEQLVDPEKFESLAAYVAELQAPIPILFPPRWASDVLMAVLLDKPFPWEEFGLLLSAAVATTALGRWLTTWLYDDGRAKAQEARTARFAKSPILDFVISLWSRPLSPRGAAIFTKDVKTFVRDPSQWSQLIVVGSILIIVLTSIASFPLDTFAGPWLDTFRKILAFLDLGLIGFVMAAVAARFQFTAVSAEGRAFWWIRTGPIDPQEYLWSKVWPGMLPMLIVGELLAFPSSAILGAGPFLTGVACTTALGLAFALSGLAIGMGAIYPDFKLDNAARAASGPAGMLFMVAALTLVAAVIAAEAFPVYMVLRAEQSGLPITGAEWVIGGVCLLLAAGLCAAATVIPIRVGARRLWAREGAL